MDGEKRKLDSEMLVVADDSGIVAIAGIMGGIDTEVTSETTNILLESAHFEFLNNRRSSQVLKLKTEASESPIILANSQKVICAAEIDILDILALR